MQTSRQATLIWAIPQPRLSHMGDAKQLKPTRRLLFKKSPNPTHLMHKLHLIQTKEYRANITHTATKCVAARLLKPDLSLRSKWILWSTLWLWAGLEILTLHCLGPRRAGITGTHRHGRPVLFVYTKSEITCYAASDREKEMHIS